MVKATSYYWKWNTAVPDLSFCPRQFLSSTIYRSSSCARQTSHDPPSPLSRACRFSNDFHDTSNSDRSVSARRKVFICLKLRMGSAIVQRAAGQAADVGVEIECGREERLTRKGARDRWSGGDVKAGPGPVNRIFGRTLVSTTLGIHPAIRGRFSLVPPCVSTIKRREIAKGIYAPRPLCRELWNNFREKSFARAHGNLRESEDRNLNAVAITRLQKSTMYDVASRIVPSHRQIRAGTRMSKKYRIYKMKRGFSVSSVPK